MIISVATIFKEIIAFFSLIFLNKLIAERNSIDIISEHATGFERMNFTIAYLLAGLLIFLSILLLFKDNINALIAYVLIFILQIIFQSYYDFYEPFGLMPYLVIAVLIVIAFAKFKKPENVIDSQIEEIGQIE